MSDIAEAEQLVHNWQARILEKAELARDLAARVAAVSATAESRSGAVRVTVDNVGVPVEIRLDGEVGSWPAARISNEIMATMRMAQARLTTEVEELVAAAPSAGQETGATLLASYHERFPNLGDDEAVR